MQFSWEKKYPINGKMDSLWTPRNIKSPDGSCYKVISLPTSQNIFSCLKMLMQCRKNITVEDDKKKWI